MRQIVLFFSVMAACSSCSHQKATSDEVKPKITIACAANMQFAIEKLIEDFNSKTTVECEIVISSSGKLTAQIREGAPYDVFVSADMKYPLALHKDGKTFNDPRVYCRGRLVLWSATPGVKANLNALTDPEVEHISIANPKTAPYGRASVEVLENVSLYDSVLPKLVYGESISQVNQFIISGSAEVGFTALSVVLAPEMKTSTNWTEINDSLYSPIEQGVVLVGKQENNAAQQFFDYLFSSDARRILKEFGYSVDE